MKWAGKNQITVRRKLLTAQRLIFAFIIFSGVFLLFRPSFGADDTDTRWLLYTEPASSKGASVEGMVFVKGGCFEMGDTFGDGEGSEKPVHTVCVGDFYMGEHEVTQGEWKAVMGDNPSYFSSCGEDCPVENVSWNDVQGFIEKLNTKIGKDYRLPTEAEWEYAARSGGKKEKYAGTSSESSIGQYAWHESNSNNKTHPVKQKKPNGLGLYDMTGNVWEWVSDCYDSGYYKNSPKDNPQGGSDCKYRSFRGGSWGSVPRYLRAAYRVRDVPDDRYNFVGFRLSLPSPSFRP